jgi:two-component system, NtrC family, sensor kinase
MVSKNEYKYVAEVSTDLAELPQVRCHIGEFNQVILNIVVNAAHAIQDVVGGTGGKGEIEIKTRLDAPNVLISIRDTGKGIPQEIIDKIFDPFFTTKEVGKGTGQGLAIARSVVVEKHGGALTVESEPGRGTTFTISLPLDGGPASTTQQIALAG